VPPPTVRCLFYLEDGGSKFLENGGTRLIKMRRRRKVIKEKV
jgi:hypothetical protein